jgi:hypothetical protein
LSTAIEKIKDVGATYLVPTLDFVRVFPQPDGTLKVIIDAKYGKEIDQPKEEEEQREIIAQNVAPEVAETAEEVSNNSIA